ncbi:hypothetical protein P3X46_015614 [Hevea brasiliensis]|uniref:Uncharacterized protein n=1 Tax=Hevea brasiliensis TaxID=3981 RepID=A0ABQ9LXV2_HEVBR|nr:hypothetical protein P3X46_015614 [Hevea brasiliensis]
MAKREISSTLKNVKREEKTKKREEEKPDGNFFSLKLNEEAANVCQPEVSDVHATGSSGQSRTSFRENGSSQDEAGCSNAFRGKSDIDLKRKQSEVVTQLQNRNKSPKTEGGQQPSPNSR